MDFDDVLRFIDQADRGQIEEMNAALRVRFRIVRHREETRNAKILKVGDRVRLIDGLRPRYLDGLTGIIDSKGPSKVVIKLDQGPTGKFRGGKVIAGAAAVYKI